MLLNSEMSMFHLTPIFAIYRTNSKIVQGFLIILGTVTQILNQIIDHYTANIFNTPW